MPEIVLHPGVLAAIEQTISRPAHALLITGPTGSGKLTVARLISAQLLNITQDGLDNYPHFMSVAPINGKAIPIEAIRDLQHTLLLKIPGKKTIARVILIENAHTMTHEAQNALLKTLEEPPADTVLVMTATSKEALLPTIGSRVRQLEVIPPRVEELKDLLIKQSYASSDIDTALLLSGNLPGITVAMLSSDKSHPLYEATVQARALLQSKAYERLLLVDTLSKQKQLSLDIVFILGQMARTALERTRSQPQSAGSTRWQKILTASYDAAEQFQGNTQAKLILTNLMLEL